MISWSNSGNAIVIKYIFYGLINQIYKWDSLGYPVPADLYREGCRAMADTIANWMFIMVIPTARLIFQPVLIITVLLLMLLT